MTTARPTPGSPTEFDALVGLAQREHRAGRLVEAAAAYRRILALRPDIAEAHNNLGNVLLEQGTLAEAVAEYERALALKPGLFQAHNNLGNALRKQGKLDRAAAHYQQAVALRPDYSEAHCNLGIALWQQGKLDGAVASYQQALAHRPDYAEAHNALGNALRDLGRLDEATACFQQALALRPNYADAHNNLGNVLLSQGKLDQAANRYQQAVALQPLYAGSHYNLGSALLNQGKLDQAAACYQQALALRPDYAEAYNNLGVINSEQGRFDEAVARYQQALAFRPDYAEAHNNLGNTLRRQGKLDQAVPHYEQALAIRPDYPDAHNNLGNILLSQGKLDQAATRYRKAIALRPDYAEAHNNLGIICREQGKFDEAAAHYQQALALRPDYGDAQLGLAACHLVQGDYERGWPLHEGRLRIPGFVPEHGLPRWTGEPLAGRSLLLLAEQGLGDTLHFVRYARLLKERGARVVLAAPAALARLLASHPDLDELFILGSAAELPRCDFHLSLLSAPATFRTTASTIPGEVPYLWADPDLTAAWCEELAGIDDFKIGIVWQGSREFESDRWRSISLAHFAPLAKLPGVRLVSLQKGFGSEQVAKVDFPVLDLSNRLDEAAGPFMDTAAVIRGLDLVVAPDTAIAHLAGALGAPVWVALQFSPNWRWLLERDDSPWYPTMRLFRQTAFGEWSSVFERIAKAVEAHRSAARQDKN